MRERPDTSVVSPEDRYRRAMEVYRHGGLFSRKTLSPPGVAAASIRTGDIVLRLSEHVGSLGLAGLTLSGFSHCGVVFEREGQRWMADCFPPEAGHNGGVRSMPWARWSGHGAHRTIHWLALRHPRMDAGLAQKTLERMLESKLPYSLVFDTPGQDVHCLEAQQSNCATFTFTFLQEMGIDCGPAVAYFEVIRNMFLHFVRLKDGGFYDILGTCGAGMFFEAAQANGLLRLRERHGGMLPPAFCELLPEFEPVAYEWMHGLEQSPARFVGGPYRRILPVLRMALACHGVLPAEVPAAFLKAGVPVSGAGGSDGQYGEPLDGVKLCLEILLRESYNPSNFLIVPLEAMMLTLGSKAMHTHVLRGLVALAPAALGVAGRAGWKPLKVLAEQKGNTA